MALAGLCLILLDILLWPTLRSLAGAELRNLTTVAMYQAVQAEVAKSVLDYHQLFHVETDAAGQVTFMQPDTLAVNNLAAGVAVAIQEKIAGLGPRSIYVPLGRALGSRLLGGAGPRIGVKVYPLIVESVQIWDSFEAAGINQTRHRIYLKVRLTATAAVPFSLAEIPIEGDFPIAEAIIVGRVPDTYVGGVWLPFFPRDAGSEPASSEPTGGP
jgi:sporulation protein YunB